MVVPPVEELVDYILIEEVQLKTRVAELAKSINDDYRQLSPVLLVGILKGCVLFLTDLSRSLTVPHAIDFLDISSYGAGMRQSTGDIRVLMDLHQSIEGYHVLVVEDIVDSGRTLNHVIRRLEARKPASLKICTLLNKAERREIPVPLSYVGFTIPDVFVFGYGLDIDEYYRNLPHIAVVKPDIQIHS